MLRRKFFIPIAVAILIIAHACRPDNVQGVVQIDPNFDHAGQSLIDNDSLIQYFETHYYDDTIDSLRPLIAGVTPLIEDPRLMVADVVEQEVNYKLYYFVNRVGSPDPVKGFPTRVDSILVQYRGEYLIDNDNTEFFDQRVVARWFTLDQVIAGWSLGFPNFRGGRNVTTNGPIEYEGGGKGVLFIPSGLGYRNEGFFGFGTGSIPVNANLMFYIDLFDIVENTDHDNDGVASILEDVDGDGDVTNDDTDRDGIINYIDNDDDGDLIPTLLEDANGDGDPTNDFSDPRNPTLPDYLNPDIN